MTAIKMCGMTRSEDVAQAAALGAAFVGCVFAGGPRQRTPAQAAGLFAPLGQGPGPRRAGVFADVGVDEIARVAVGTGLDVVQLHGDPDAAAVAAARRATRAEIWAVLRCREGRLPASAAAIWAAADAVLLDAYVPGVLGGTGLALPWAALVDAVASLRAAGSRTRVVLAGGLTPDNVARAIALLHPDVVDVSSGIESAPGVKDHARMRAFADAVASAPLADASMSARDGQRT